MIEGGLVSDLIACALLIGGVKAMSHPRHARRGIFIAGVGMLVAILGNAVFGPTVTGVRSALALVAIALGGGLAWYESRRVAMTAMPQMVALFNGLGGGAAALIVLTRLFEPGRPAGLFLVFGCLALAIGGLSFGGSGVALIKLAGRWGKPLRFRFQNGVHALLVLVILGLGTGLFLHVGSRSGLVVLLAVLSVLLGVGAAAPIGGADMPVVISLYNALTGVAVGVDGLMLGNPALIVAGTVVGASGILLTRLMARAMNRSLGQVLFAHFGEVAGTDGSGSGTFKEMDLADAAVALAYARRVRVVPGYGLATAQAQHKLAELTELLRQRNVEVRFAIHPVAGRMPGHMNVLLAESGVPYDLVQDLEEANPEFPQIDVALVIGANDVVNPGARNNPASPLYGMPVLDVDRARRTLVIKRGRGTGFAGVENPLFSAESTYLLYGDARAVLGQLVGAVKSL